MLFLLGNAMTKYFESAKFIVGSNVVIAQSPFNFLDYSYRHPSGELI